MKVLFGWKATWLSMIGKFVQIGVLAGVLAGMVITYDPAEKSVDAEVNKMGWVSVKVWHLPSSLTSSTGDWVFTSNNRYINRNCGTWGSHNAHHSWTLALLYHIQGLGKADTDNCTREYNTASMGTESLISFGGKYHFDLV